MTHYSFCENTWAGPATPWHIRPLTGKGRKLGGGADTYALCGMQVAWDLAVPIDEHHLTHCCQKCAAELLAIDSRAVNKTKPMLQCCYRPGGFLDLPRCEEKFKPTTPTQACCWIHGILWQTFKPEVKRALREAAK